jgi:hypothetical protein
MAAERISIDPQQVIHETVDGEVILIALQTGCYYSIEGTGAKVWTALAAGRSTAEVIAELESAYVAEPGAIGAAVSELVERIVAEQLAAPVDLNGSTPAVDERQAQPAADRAPFKPPVFHKFTDMQDFLLVDPIHDVGDAGWPHAQTA